MKSETKACVFGLVCISIFMFIYAVLLQIDPDTMNIFQFVGSVLGLFGMASLGYAIGLSEGNTRGKNSKVKVYHEDPLKAQEIVEKIDADIRSKP